MSAVTLIDRHSEDSAMLRVDSWHDARVGHLLINRTLTVTLLRNNEGDIADLVIASRFRAFIVPLAWDRDAVQIKPRPRTQTIAATQRLKQLAKSLINATWPEVAE